MKSNKKKKHILRKTLLWIAAILIIIRIAIPIAGVIAVNRLLPGILGTECRIGHINLLLIRGRAAVGRIKIEQPQGFEGEPLFKLKRISVNADLSSFKSDRTPTIESVTIKELSLNLIRNTDGTMNIASLGSSSATNTPAGTNSEDEVSSPQAIVLNKLTVNDMSLSYLDLTYDPPITVKMENCNLTLTNLLFDASQTDTEKLDTSLILTAVLKQQDMHDAFIGISAELGVLGTNVPPVNSAVRITGLELSTLGASVPAGVPQILGGSCVDIYIDLAMAIDILDCKAKVKTEDHTMPLAVGGTPSHIIVDKSTALGNVITRPGALIGGLIGDTGGAGLELIKGAGKTTAAVGSGAAKIVGGLGKGLFHTAKGVATADLEGIKHGVHESTVGTAKETMHTVSDTAGTAAHSVGDAASSAVGKDDADAWRSGSKTRWTELWQKAKKKVKEAPFPKPDNK